MTDEWTQTTLGEVAYIQQGKTLPVKAMTGGAHPVYGANGVIGWYREGNLEHSAVALGCRGSCGTVHKTEPGAWLANNVMAIWPRSPDETSVEFLALALEGADFVSTGVISGQVQPQITRTSLSPLPISVPPLVVQRRIVDLMEHLDTHLANLETEREATVGRHNALAEHALGGFPEVTVGELAIQGNGLVGGPFGSDLSRKHYEPLGVPVIRGTNMPNEGRYIGGGFVYVSEEKADSLSRNSAVAGDVIFTQRGTLGQVGLVPEGTPRYVVSQSQMRLRVDPRVTTNEWVYFQFSRPSMVASIKSRNTATANPHINLGILSSLSIPLADLEVQEQVVSLLKASQDEHSELSREMDAAQRLRSTILARLLSGAHEIPASYDALLAVS